MCSWSQVPSQRTGICVGGLGPPGGPLAPLCELLLTLLSSPIARLQKEVRLAQKADYSAERTASPLPYDKISVRCPPPFLQGFWCLGQAYVPPRGRPPPPGSCRGPGTLHSCHHSLCSLGTRRWLRVPRCTTTSTKSSRCSPWRSKQPLPGNKAVAAPELPQPCHRLRIPIACDEDMWSLCNLSPQA